MPFLVPVRNLQEGAFEVDVGWQGPKMMVPFRAQTDHATRLATCRAARGQATIHWPLWKELVDKVTNGVVTVIEGFTVDSFQQTDGHVELTVSPTSGLYQARERPSSMERAVKRAAEVEQATALPGDEVWLACGHSHVPEPFLKSLLPDDWATPNLFAGGYPRCDDSTCVLPGMPVYVAGASALLSVGPTAGTVRYVCRVAAHYGKE